MIEDSSNSIAATSAAREQRIPAPKRRAGASPRIHLHIDGVALLVTAVAAYVLVGGNWWLFGLLLFAPDLFMLGYLAGPRTGAVVYNLGHSLLWPAILIGLSLFVLNAEAGATVLRSVGIVWAAHIGLDRALGYGYKYPTRFGDTDIARA